MITALHGLVYADDAGAARAFFRDVLQFDGVDTGGGWLIFRTGPSQLGVHPARWEHDGQSGSIDQPFDLSLACDDLDATMAELRGRGAEFEGDVVQEPWGRTAQLKVPGASTMILFQPAYDPPALAHPDQPTNP